jgi:sulfonate transport system substrate-binding protein
VRFSYQRSSTLLTLLKANHTLEPLFAAKGFTPSWSLFEDVIIPMTAGTVEFDADVADAVPIFTQSAGAKLTFYARERGSPAAEAIIVPAGSAIHTVADLKGRSVAVHRGSGSHFVLAAALKRVGLSFQDIVPAYLTPSGASAAFERGSVDAWSIWDPFLALVEAKMPTRTLCDATGLSSYHRYYTAATRFVEAHPDLVADVYDALVAVGTWVKRNPQEAARQLSPLWGGMPTAVIERAVDRRTYAVEPVEKGQLGDQQRIADTFYEARLIPEPIDATDVKIWHPQASRT